MDSSISEFEIAGHLVIEAGARGQLRELKEIRRMYDLLFQEICDEYRDSSGKNVLHHVAEMGHLEICEFLIKDVQVYIDPLTHKRNTPLTQAVKRERVEIVKYLVNEGAERDKENSRGCTPLHYAAKRNNTVLIEYLLGKDAYINHDSVHGTPLQFAISRRNVEAVRSLLSHGAKRDYCLLVLEGPLACAIKSRSFECMELLLRSGADPKPYIYGFSPLIYAAREGDTRYLQRLLEAGAYPNINVGNIYTALLQPIEEAAVANNREAVELLFLRTIQLEGVPEWSVDGIMDYYQSEEAKEKIEMRRNKYLVELDDGAQIAFRNKDYTLPVVNYRIACELDPSNPKWRLKGSLVHAHVDRRLFALLDAEKCIRLDTHCPDPIPHHGDAASTSASASASLAATKDQIFEKFLMAGLTFAANPYKDREADRAFRLASFDLFALYFLASNPEEILSFPPPPSKEQP